MGNMRIRAMEDEKIIDLYWNRDQGAIRHTEEKYGSYCGRIAKNILLNKEDCEECVNDTWLRVWTDTGNCIRQKEEKGKWSLFLMNCQIRWTKKSHRTT